MLRPATPTKPKRLSAKTRAFNQKASKRPGNLNARAKVNADSGRAKLRRTRGLF